MPEILQLIKKIYIKQIKEFDDFPKIKKIILMKSSVTYSSISQNGFTGIGLSTKIFK